jgi:hypothetical protein
MKKYPYIKDIPITEVIPNTYNPNTMSDEEVSMLRDNIIRVGYIDPILVVPLDDGMYRIIDGEHRWNAQQMEGADKIWCVVVSPDVFDEKTQKLQTVRANKIRGAFDTTRFNNLVRDLMTNHEVEFDDMAYELGFTDENEWARLTDETRRSLPSSARKEFDKKIKNVKSEDALYKLVERLLNKYGDTLPGRFLIFEFGREHNLMVQIDGSEYSLLLSKFRECLEFGVTVDSVLINMLKGIDIPTYIDDNRKMLTTIKEDEDAGYIE